MRKPLVSIITPTYNHGNFIKKCIDSVLYQTYQNWEMIIIDDGSTDDTPKIIEQYGDDRIRYIRQRHRGIWKLKDTYNRALKYSNGELIAILEGDDFWPSYKLEKQVNAFESEDVVLCWGRAGIYHSERKKITAVKPSSIRHSELLKFESTRKLILDGNFIPAVTVMIRREALQAIGGFKQTGYTPYVDYPTWLELSLVGKFRAVDDILGYWRIHHRQVTRTHGECMFKSGTRLVIDFFNSLPCDLKSLLGLEYEDIIETMVKRIAVNYVIKGRQHLIVGEWEKAREHFIKSLSGPPSVKIRGVLGIMFSYLQINMEWLAKFLGRETISVYWN